MRVATWNVNSAKQRAERILAWLQQRSPDVCCLQELKLTDEAFADRFTDALAELGYEFATSGQPQWNGVALLSRVGLTDIERGLPNGPGFPTPETLEARAIFATCGKVRVGSLYIPNGREVGAAHYEYKLAWLEALRASASVDPDNLLLCGDFNIAPTDRDVFDPAFFEGKTHVSAAEREAFQGLLDVGLTDLLRERWPQEQFFTYWDYRQMMFPRNAGMRIDFLLGGRSLAKRVAAAWVDRGERKGKGASDHAPVVVDFDSAPDGDIGPAVPPPSRR